MWNELESFLKSNLHSDNHKQVHQCLLDCHKSSFGDDKSAEKVDLDEALNQLDSIGKYFMASDDILPLIFVCGLPCLEINRTIDIVGTSESFDKIPSHLSAVLYPLSKINKHHEVTRDGRPKSPYWFECAFVLPLLSAHSSTEQVNKYG